MSKPFGIEIKFNILHDTGKGVNVKILREASHFLYKCACIILEDPKNNFNKEALKSYDKLCRKSIKVAEKADELEDEC